MSIDKIEVTPVNINEIDEAASTLFLAFVDDPLMLWVFGDKEAYQARALEQFKTCVKYCVLYGMALKTPNFESVALRRNPGDIKWSIWRIFRSGMYKNQKILGAQGFKRLMQFDEETLQERKKHMGEQPYLYCWMVGTRPEHQRKGFGRAIMEYTFNIAKRNKVACYLETSNPSSLQVHLHHGYEVVSELQLKDSDLIITSMKKCKY